LDNSKLKAPGFFLLNCSFILIGICTTILGPILPALPLRWILNDAHAGSLFTAQFIGSSLGGMLAAVHPFKSTVLGFITVAVGLTLLATAGPLAALPLLFVYGLGVSLVLTGINLKVSSIAGRNRGSPLSWLNFFWSLGATICPVVAAIFIGYHLLIAFLFILPAACVCMAVLIGVQGSLNGPAELPSSHLTERPTQSVRFFSGYFAALLFLYVGIETALGGWLSTLAARLPHSAMMGAFVISASSFFWFALLIGRGVSPWLLKQIPETRLQPLAVLASVASMCLLLVARSYIGIAIASALVGFSLAPIFPLNLSFFLSHADQSKSAGVVLAICGLGGAVLPWLTGTVSTYRHSLQWGLSVPLLASLCMLGLSLYYVFFIRAGVRPTLSES
jgi:fucose permease